MTAAERLRAARGVKQRYRTDRRIFERIVREVLATLPETFREHLDNVAIVVAEWPTEADERHGADEHAGESDLLGLYQGIPFTERTTDYHLTVPDQITIYRQPILAACRSEIEAREEIRLTVLHEIGHFFGLGDDELP
jgi:predicted Zn-dependent protease with MMP-like domain